MKKIILLGLTLGVSSITAMPPAHTTELGSGYRHYTAVYPRDHRYYHASEFPYFRSFASGIADPWWPGSRYCYFGSYVACVSSKAFCWQRCY